MHFVPFCFALRGGRAPSTRTEIEENYFLLQRNDISLLSCGWKANSKHRRAGFFFCLVRRVWCVSDFEMRVRVCVCVLLFAY